MYKNFSSTNTYCDILKIYIYTSNLFLTFLSIFSFKGVRLLISQSTPPQKKTVHVILKFESLDLRKMTSTRLKSNCMAEKNQNNRHGTTWFFGHFVVYNLYANTFSWLLYF